MKNKKVIISLIIAVVLLSVISVCVIISMLNDNNRLTVQEKEWITSNKNNIVSINVINDLNIFGKDGKGVYFDFLDSLSEKYLIQINPVTFNLGDNVEGLSLTYSIRDDIESLYDDEFVLVSKTKEKIDDISKINSLKIGILNNYKDYITNYVKGENQYIGFDKKEDLLKEFKDNEEVKYIIVPRILYLDEILKNDYNIIYHISDAKVHIGVTKDGSDFSNIISKYFNTYKKKEFDESFNNNKLDTFVSGLNIPSTELDKIKSGTYKYGFVNNGPYEMISGGTFGGINAEYLRSFSNLIGVNIDFVKYRNIDKLNKAIKDGKINIYFDYYSLNDNKSGVDSNILLEYKIIANVDNNIVVNSLDSLKNKEIYIENNTKLYDYLRDNTKLNIKTYDGKKGLKKAVKKDYIICIDSNKYESYKNDILTDYSERYSNTIVDNYNFILATNNSFNKLFSKYLNTIDNNEMKYIGLNNYYVTNKSGILFGTLAKYILLLVAILIIIVIIIYKKSKKIKIARKIKREDKMRFIDQLTSLKNRNYLTENLENWNNNTIYPQAVIVLDINKLQDINDTLGYEKGDEQIQAVANVLIKTQLDNTDIIRTDGNEFLIYLVGYETKQITSYIHKLNREFKKLPFETGVSVGYSMITDDVKSVEDATNEAVEQVKLQKEEIKDE
ncbi:MAG: GGDEF domain-containing protein [Firmicutes bacterium]|nr:GGDEF domain-containing protein [Bacillota bacterium]